MGHNMSQFSEGDLVFAPKAGTRPAWPAKVIALDTKREKYRVFLYCLNVVVDVGKDKLVLVTLSWEISIISNGQIQPTFISQEIEKYKQTVPIF